MNTSLTSLFFIVFICITIGAAAGLEYESDQNRDGKPDKWCRVSADGKKIITQTDQNYDGIVDYKSEYMRNGRPIYEELDYNYDGIMDTFYYYTNGVLEKEEIDTNNDKKIDIWVYLYKGIYIKKIEKDTDFDGKADTVKEYGK
jgi:hypothetical protein